MNRITSSTSALLLALAALPAGAVVLQTDPGIVGVAGGGPGFVIIDANNDTDDWIDPYSDLSYSGTLYYSFIGTVDEFDNGENAGNSFGGLHLMNGTDEQLLVGNNWGAWAWSYDANGFGADLNSANAAEGNTYEFIELDTPMLFTVRIDFIADADDNVTVWFNPNGALSEGAQPAELTTMFQTDASFNSINLRSGNGANLWNITDVIFATTFADVVPAVALAGDTDGDGDIDDFDLINAIVAYTGSLEAGTGGKTLADGDTDDDGDVDDFDLINMIVGYTGSLSAPTSAVPEPASVALLGLGGLLVARRRRSA